MKTKLYRTITLVLAIVILLGVTPAFAAGYSTAKNSVSYWENHEYDIVPYDYNVSADPNGYIPFSAVWEYGDRTSASSKGPCWELADGVCCLPRKIMLLICTDQYMSKSKKMPLNISYLINKIILCRYSKIRRFLFFQVPIQK